MRKSLFFLALLTCAFFTNTFAQALYKVTMDEKVANSTLIVEGKVVSQKSFWNPQHTMIYTSNSVEITKIFKGETTDTTIEVLTVGGSVEGDHIEASDLLTLSTNQVGLFFCYPNTVRLKSPLTNKQIFDVYGSAQGFLHYNLQTKQAIAPFADYKITDELYPQIQQKTGRVYKNLKPSFKVENLINARTTAVGITGFSPASVNAGALLDPTNNLLTITGSGFGSATGSAAILFDDANDGTGGTDYAVAYNDPLVISWTDNQIQVRVPSRAGTGTFQVRDASGATGISPVALNVLYSILTTTFNIGGLNYTKESNLMNVNGSGGYTVLYSTNTAGSGVDFNASPAKATFQRALTTWKEINGYNITEGGTTTIQAVSSDPVNVIMFDNANTGTSPLAAGVLAVCYSFNSMCTADPVNYQARKLGFDVVVRNNGFSTGSTTFTIGPCPPNASNYLETDLETVIFHELGHSLNLGHINDSYQGGSVGHLNPGKIMNYAVVNSVKRVSPDYSAKVGADYAIMQQANQYGSCTAANTEMTPVAKISEVKDDCPLTFPTATISQNSVVSFDLVHATSNKLVDPVYTKVTCDASGVAETNNAWYAFKTNSAVSSTLNLSVTGYTATPSSLTTCAQLYAGIPVTGVRLSLYQVTSCPSPNAFPTPVTCATFAGSGALSPISGLTPNTTYLLYVDGIENTKVSFNLVFGGIALPVKVKDFSANALDGYNAITWVSEAFTGIDNIVLQKSNDGTVFTDLTRLTSTTDIEKGAYKDYNYFAKTYYRLAYNNGTQTTSYSNIALVQREAKDQVFVYPNPAKDAFYVQINNTTGATYKITLYNMVGQAVRTLYNGTGSQNLKVPTTGLTEGAYQLIVSTENGVYESHKILVTK